MKDHISAFELKFMVEELQALVGARLQQIYEPKGLFLQFHKSNVGKFFLRIESNALWLADEKPDMPEKIVGLCQALRKYLKGKKLAILKQVGSERIAELELRTQNEVFYLVVELFANGNVVLLDKNRKIIKALEEREWKDRTVKRGAGYELPPSAKNIFCLAKADVEGKDEKQLAMIGFGKLYAREIIARGGGFEGYKSLMNAVASARVYDDGEITPISLVQKPGGKKYDSFSKAIADNWKEEVIVKKDSKVDKLVRQIEMQQVVVDDLEKKSAEEQKKGELIYEHFQDVQLALKNARGPQKIILDL